MTKIEAIRSHLSNIETELRNDPDRRSALIKIAEARGMLSAREAFEEQVDRARVEQLAQALEADLAAIDASTISRPSVADFMSEVDAAT